ncbi:hypothetical protein TNCV_2740231 [Trichonephila clavipes]|nr:hypothetical protein TNCV_2740231 [Trichonephila clavipes]
MNPIYTIFTPDRVVNRDQSRLGPSGYLICQCVICVWEALKPKVYRNKSQELQPNISDEIAAILAVQLHLPSTIC